MKLRWVILYDEDGRKSETVLQYKENEEDYWKDVPIDEIKTWKIREE